MKIGICLSGLLMLFLLGACSKTVVPEGEIENKQVEIGKFSHLKLNGKFRAFYINSDKDFIDIETYPNLFENLKIENREDSLVISEINPVGNIDFYSVNIYTKNTIHSVSISDSIEMNTNHVIKSDYLNLKLKNNAKFIGEIEVDKSMIDMSDLSLMNARGKAKNVSLQIKDTANFLSPYFMIDVIDLKAINQTYTEINIKDSLKGSVDDTSKLLYYNDPVRGVKIGQNTIVNHHKLN